MMTTEKATEASIAMKPVAVTPTPIKAAVASTASKPEATAAVLVATPKPAVKAMAKQVAKKPVVKVKVTAKSVVPTVAKPAAKPKAKPVAKALPKLAPKAAVKAPVKVTASAALKGKATKDAKAKKPKLVRDSFTIPKVEYTVLDDLKQRAGKLASAVKKSELIRAGVKALAAMSDAAFLSALKAVPAIKTGRPSKSKD
jgi:hypothetical protein